MKRARVHANRGGGSGCELPTSRVAHLGCQLLLHLLLLPGSLLSLVLWEVEEGASLGERGRQGTQQGQAQDGQETRHGGPGETRPVCASAPQGGLVSIAECFQTVLQAQ